MAIDKEIKKKITEDWLYSLPQLSAYAQNKLYKVVGCCVVGIELIKLPYSEEYRPHFVIYPLWKQDVKTSLDIPIILKEYYNKKGLQYSIPYQKHDIFFNDVLESVKMQTPLSLNKDVFFNEIIYVIDEYSNSRPLNAAPNSYLQAVLQEAKLKIALFISIEEAQGVLGQITKRNWDINHFKACGIDVSDWLNSLENTIVNRDEFLKQIELNKQDKKIEKLKSSELLL